MNKKSKTKSVTSSHIKHVTYDNETKRLTVGFKNGSTYSYDNVPESVHSGLLGASSVGGYFADYIKDQYKTHKH